MVFGVAMWVEWCVQSVMVFGVAMCSFNLFILGVQPSIPHSLSPMLGFTL